MPDSTFTDTTSDQRSPEEIERDIRATQEDMSRTVEQIGGELSARNILNSLLDKAEDGGIDARYFLDMARRNPLALGMITIGGLWLVSDADARPSALGIRRGSPGSSGDFGSSASSSFSSRDTDGWHPDHRRYVEYMSRYQPEAGEDDQAYRRRRDLARANYFMIEQDHDEDEGAFRHRLDAATQTARDSWSKASESAHDMARGARDRARSAAGDVQAFYGDNPLLIGLASAFVGAVVGAMIPATRTEERYVGGLGEQALDAAGAQAKKAGEAARHKKDEMIGQIDDRLGAEDGRQGSGMDARQGAGAGQQI